MSDFGDGWLDTPLIDSDTEEGRDLRWMQAHPISKTKLALLYLGFALFGLAFWAIAVIVVVNLVQWAW